MSKLAKEGLKRTKLFSFKEPKSTRAIDWQEKAALPAAPETICAVDALDYLVMRKRDDGVRPVEVSSTDTCHDIFLKQCVEKCSVFFPFLAVIDSFMFVLSFLILKKCLYNNVYFVSHRLRYACKGSY